MHYHTDVQSIKVTHKVNPPCHTFEVNYYQGHKNFDFVGIHNTCKKKESSVLYSLAQFHCIISCFTVNFIVCNFYFLPTPMILSLIEVVSHIGP